MTALGQPGAVVPTPNCPHSIRPWLLGLGLCLVLMGLAACANRAGTEGSEDDAAADGQSGGPVAPSFDPVVFPNQKVRKGGGSVADKRLLPPDDSGWMEKWQLASQYAAGGYEEQALQVLNGALSQSPPDPWGTRMRALKTSMRVHKAETVLLRVDARGVKDYVSFGADVDFVIRLRNVSNRKITLLAPVAAGALASPSALMLEINRRDRDIYATELSRRWNRTVFILRPGDAAIEIPSGGVHEIPVRVPAQALGDPITGLRVIELGGMLRPTRFRLAGERRTVRLPIRVGRVIALPEGSQRLVADPLGAMHKAIETVAPAHLLIACEFVPPNRRVEAVEILAQALADGHRGLKRAAVAGLSLLRERAVGDRLGPLIYPLMLRLEDTPGRVDPLMEALAVLSGMRFAPDPRLWKDWWRREATLRTTLQPLEEPGSR